MEKVYKIKYQSENSYDEPVSEAFYQLIISPHGGSGQTVLNEKIKISTGSIFNVNNSFGFRTTRVTSRKQFSNFNIIAEFDVCKSHFEIDPADCLGVSSERRALYSKDYLIDNYLFLKPTPLTCITRKEIIPIKKENQPLLGFLTNLNAYIGTLIEYRQNTTNIETTASEVLEKKLGVCQDLTHVFIGMARANGIACRYVSGYLNQGAEFLGTAMMHAWAEALIPKLGWVGFDPTNNMMADYNHIKVAHGFDFKDCSPIKGVLKTSGNNNTIHQVLVAEQQQQ